MHRSLIFSLALSSQLVGMQPFDESSPLVNPTSLDESSIFFDGTRRFYDVESKKKIRNEAIKNCMCQAVCCGFLGALAGGILGTTCGACFSCCGANTSGALFCMKQGGLFVEFNTICGGAGCIVGSATESILDASDVRQAMKDDVEKVKWDSKLVISDEIIAQADRAKSVTIAKDSLARLLMYSSSKSQQGDCVWPWLARLAAGFYRTRDQIVETLKERAKRTSSNSIPVSEHELLSLLQDTWHRTGVQYDSTVEAYARLALLAHHGWLSFGRTEKYPIRCETKYFDAIALTPAQQRWYNATNQATIYVPYCPELAHVYKFEDDPHYVENPDYQHNQLVQELLNARAIHKNYVATSSLSVTD